MLCLLSDGHQGGPFNEEEVREAEKDPWLHAKISLRRWDDLAKDPEMQTPPLEHFEEMTVRSLMRSRAHASVAGPTDTPQPDSL